MTTYGLPSFKSIIFPMLVIKNRIRKTSSKAPKLNRTLLMGIWLMFLVCICESGKIFYGIIVLFSEFEKFDGTKT